MLKKLFVLFATILFVTQVSAIDKNKVDLNTAFWGTWGIFNPATVCTENYQFNQPGTFIYKAQQKQLAGEFAVVRHKDNKLLDVLIFDVQQDNGSVGCGGDSNDYKGKKSHLSLKWISPISAEICTDEIGKKCTGLYLNKR